MEIVKKFLKRNLSFLAGLPIPDRLLRFADIVLMFMGFAAGLCAAWDIPTFVPDPIVIKSAAALVFLFFVVYVIFSLVDIARDYVADETEEQ